MSFILLLVSFIKAVSFNSDVGSQGGLLTHVNYKTQIQGKEGAVSPLFFDDGFLDWLSFNPLSYQLTNVFS